MQNLTEFDEYKFSNASKEDLKFGDADDKEKARAKARGFTDNTALNPR